MRRQQKIISLAVLLMVLVLVGTYLLLPRTEQVPNVYSLQAIQETESIYDNYQAEFDQHATPLCQEAPSAKCILNEAISNLVSSNENEPGSVIALAKLTDTAILLDDLPTLNRLINELEAYQQETLLPLRAPKIALMKLYLKLGQNEQAYEILSSFAKDNEVFTHSQFPPTIAIDYLLKTEQINEIFRVIAMTKYWGVDLADPPTSCFGRSSYGDFVNALVSKLLAEDDFDRMLYMTQLLRDEESIYYDPRKYGAVFGMVGNIYADEGYQQSLTPEQCSSLMEDSKKLKNPEEAHMEGRYFSDLRRLGCEKEHELHVRSYFSEVEDLEKESEKMTNGANSYLTYLLMYEGRYDLLSHAIERKVEKRGFGKYDYRRLSEYLDLASKAYHNRFTEIQRKAEADMLQIYEGAVAQNDISEINSLSSLLGYYRLTHQTEKEHHLLEEAGKKAQSYDDLNKLAYLHTLLENDSDLFNKYSKYTRQAREALDEKNKSDISERNHKLREIREAAVHKNMEKIEMLYQELDEKSPFTQIYVLKFMLDNELSGQVYEELWEGYMKDCMLRQIRLENETDASNASIIGATCAGYIANNVLQENISGYKL